MKSKFPLMLVPWQHLDSCSDVVIGRGLTVERQLAMDGMTITARCEFENWIAARRPDRKPIPEGV